MNTKKFYTIIPIGLIILGTCLLFVQPVKASETLFEYYNVNDDATYTIMGISNYQGQVFTVGTVGNNQHINVTSVKVKILRQGSPGTCYLYLLDVNQNTHYPNYGLGCPLKTVTFNGNSLSTSATWYEFNFTEDIYVNKGRLYSIVLIAPSGSIGNTLRWRYDSSSPTYTGGERVQSVDGGVTWTTDNTDDFMFEIYGKNVYNENITVYSNFVNCTGTNETFYTVYDGFKAWVNVTGYDNSTTINFYENLLNTTGTYEYNYNWQNGYNIWNNYSSYANLINNLINVTGTHEIVCIDGIYTIWANYTGNESLGCTFPFYFNYSDENITINVTVNGCNNTSLANNSINQNRWLLMDGFSFSPSTFLFVYLFVLLYFIYNERTNQLFIKSFNHMIFIIFTVVLLLGIEAGEFITDFGFTEVERILLLPFIIVFITLLWVMPFSNK